MDAVATNITTMLANMIVAYSESPKCPKLVQTFHHRSAIVSLEDDAVADGGQQIVEVELVFVVAGIPAMLLPKFHQSFSKPVM